jgi:hypothetical protein
MYRLLIFSTLLLGYLQGSAQLYMPRNIRAAYEKGTRSPDGQPGRNYWQNSGVYDITVTAAPPDRIVKGTETIAYTNNSPDTLRAIVIRLVLNIHQPGAAREQGAGKDYLTEGVHFDKYMENGQERTAPASNGTAVAVLLAKPLMPKETLNLSIDWHYEISLESGREGMLDSTTYYLAYFYPRVSVYDDYNGWDRVPFVDSKEFYNDFNDYTLHVKVPDNYLVWATGILQNPGDVLQPEYATKLKNSFSSDAVSHIATLDEVTGGKVTAHNPMNTWTWTSQHITDVTVALSNHYVWDATSVLVDDASGRRVSVQAAFNDKSADFHHMAEFGSHAIGWFSHNWPGVPFPFPKMTCVQGEADMEYPMMINDGSTPNLNFSRLVADHEIAHSYFPFYMGINESRYAFMDEGWATTLELLIGRSELKGDSADAFYKTFRVRGWINDPSTEEDMPIINPANAVNGIAYGNNAYGKPSLGYLAMMDMLGPDLFGKCLHEYMDLWHGKHPIPWDFFYTFDHESGQDLDWFWNNWYFTNGYIDLGISGVADKKVTVENIGGYDAPFDLIATYTDGTKQTFHQTSMVWKSGSREITLDVAFAKPLQSLDLDGGIFMDADRSNNSWKPR